MRHIDGTVTPNVPFHPLEEIDHGVFQQQATQDGQKGELPAGVQGHSDCLKIGREDKHFNEPQAQRCVVMLPNDSRDQQEFPIARQQQGFQQQNQVRVLFFCDGSLYPQESKNADKKGSLF